jgi:uroporphyrinogen decarboxylase
MWSRLRLGILFRVRQSPILTRDAGPQRPPSVIDQDLRRTPAGCYAQRLGDQPLSESQNEFLNQASVVPGTGEQAEPLAGVTPDGPNRAGNPGADPEGPNRAVTTAAQTADPTVVNNPATAAGANGSRFVRACLRLPVDRTPVWFLRQAGRYMPEYMAVRKHHSLLDICRTPEIAAEVTITAAERLGVDAAIIFADLLLPLTPMGLDFEFVANEGPQIHTPLRTVDQAKALRTDRTADLLYVSRAIEKVAAHFAPPRADGDTLGIIGFCGAPFTLASYMIEGGSSRNYIETKRMMYASKACHSERSEEPPHLSDLPLTTDHLPLSSAWSILMDKLITVLTEYAAQQIEAGADVIQVFDSWVGALSPSDYGQYALAPTTRLIRNIQSLGVPVIYFGVETSTLLPLMRHTGADVLGLDWRTPLDRTWRELDYSVAIQGNLDPITLFAPEKVLEARVAEVLSAAANRPGHIFNLGHGIVPTTPVDAVLSVVHQIKSAR